MENRNQLDESLFQVLTGVNSLLTCNEILIHKSFNGQLITFKRKLVAFMDSINNNSSNSSNI